MPNLADISSVVLSDEHESLICQQQSQSLQHRRKPLDQQCIYDEASHSFIVLGVIRRNGIT